MRCDGQEPETGPIGLDTGPSPISAVISALFDRSHTAFAAARNRRAGQPKVYRGTAPKCGVGRIGPDASAVCGGRRRRGAQCHTAGLQTHLAAVL